MKKVWISIFALFVAWCGLRFVDTNIIQDTIDPRAAQVQILDIEDTNFVPYNPDGCRLKKYVDETYNISFLSQVCERIDMDTETKNLVMLYPVEGGYKIKTQDGVQDYYYPIQFFARNFASLDADISNTFTAWLTGEEAISCVVALFDSFKNNTSHQRFTIEPFGAYKEYLDEQRKITGPISACGGYYADGSMQYFESTTGAAYYMLVTLDMGQQLFDVDSFTFLTGTYAN